MELHRTERSDYSVKGMTLRDLTPSGSEGVDLPSHKRSSLAILMVLPKLQGIGVELATTTVGREAGLRRVSVGNSLSASELQNFYML